MAKTIHRLPSNIVTHPQVQSRRKGEQAVLDEVKQTGVKIRHYNRIQSYMTQIPEPWDDKCHSAWGEYQNKYGIYDRADYGKHISS